MRARSTGGYDWTDPDYDPATSLDSLPPATCYRTHTQPDESRGVYGAVWLADVKRALRSEETTAVQDATDSLVVAFRRWHQDRHGYAPTVHDFRLMLDIATSVAVERRVVR